MKTENLEERQRSNLSQGLYGVGGGGWGGQTEEGSDWTMQIRLCILYWLNSLLPELPLVP